MSSYFRGMSCHVMILGVLTVLEVLLAAGGVTLAQPGQGQGILDGTESAEYNHLVSNLGEEKVYQCFPAPDKL